MTEDTIKDASAVDIRRDDEKKFPNPTQPTERRRSKSPDEPKVIFTDWAAF